MITITNDPVMYFECVGHAVAIMANGVLKGELKEELLPKFVGIILKD